MFTTQAEINYINNNWITSINNNNVYSGNRMFEAINMACNKMDAGIINIRNSGNSDNGDSKIHAIKPHSNQILDFHGNTINCNSDNDFTVGVYADRENNITIKNIHITGNPRYGFWFRGCNNMIFNNITMDLNKNNPVGLGIRVDTSTGPSNNLIINGNVNINGSAGHGIEIYSINNVNIGDITVTNTGGCGVLFNNSENCIIGMITGVYNNYNGGYATFRVANNNGQTYCKGVDSKYSGRGVFSVSGSHNCTIDWVNITNTTKEGILLEDTTNTYINSGNIKNGNPSFFKKRVLNCSINVTNS